MAVVYPDTDHLQQPERQDVCKDNFSIPLEWLGVYFFASSSLGAWILE